MPSQGNGPVEVPIMQAGIAEGDLFARTNPAEERGGRAALRPRSARRQVVRAQGGLSQWRKVTLA